MGWEGTGARLCGRTGNKLGRLTHRHEGLWKNWEGTGGRLCGRTGKAQAAHPQTRGSVDRLKLQAHGLCTLGNRQRQQTHSTLSKRTQHYHYRTVREHFRYCGYYSQIFPGKTCARARMVHSARLIRYSSAIQSSLVPRPTRNKAPYRELAWERGYIQSGRWIRQCSGWESGSVVGNCRIT